VLHDLPADAMRILIVDDHVLFAEAIRLALLDQGIGEIALASDAEHALEALDDGGRRPDVILMDVGLPDRNGIELGAEIVERWPDVRVIALTGQKDRAVLREAMRVGFHGFLTKDAQVSRVVNAINTVQGGEVVMPQALTRPVSIRYDDHAALLAAQLTDREREVLARLAEGCASDDIAAQLGITRNTVRTHVQSILAKLGVHSRLEAVAFAVRHGVVSAPARSA
jgi:two-component system nitrate/nitrite response regulator NarL